MMRSDRLRELLECPGPFVSIFFDDSHNAENAVAQTELTWRAIRRDLETQGADAPIVNAVDRAVSQARPPIGTSGRGLIAGPAGVVLDQHLSRPPEPPIVRFSELPYVVPFLAHAEEPLEYLLVAVDHTGADLIEHRGGAVKSTEVDGGGYPVHKADSAEGPGYGDPQQRTDEAARKNIRAVAEAVTHRIDEYSYPFVFVLGEIRSRTDLLKSLPVRVTERTAELTVGARHSGIDDARVREEIESVLSSQKLSVMGQTASSFEAGRTGDTGYAVEGLADVCSALRDRNVETLIIGDLGDATVLSGSDITTVAPDPNTLSEMGSETSRVVRADEALPLAAVAVGASLVRIDERIDPADGVGALLRYVPNTTSN